MLALSCPYVSCLNVGHDSDDTVREGCFYDCCHAYRKRYDRYDKYQEPTTNRCYLRNMALDTCPYRVPKLPTEFDSIFLGVGASLASINLLQILLL